MNRKIVIEKCGDANYCVHTCENSTHNDVIPDDCPLLEDREIEMKSELLYWLCRDSSDMSIADRNRICTLVDHPRERETNTCYCGEKNYDSK
jgi:predicted chitinase